MKITKLTGREVYDSRGLPALECELWLDDSVVVRSSVPSGLSCGSHEAYELRDKGQRLMGKGVSQAVDKLEHVIAPSLIGSEPEVVELDMRMIEIDGTENKSNLGANVILAASIAVARAQALVNEIELYELIASLCDLNSISVPYPMFNIINGGMHADTSLPIQEIMIIPAGAQTFRESMELSEEVFHALKTILRKNGKRVALGDEGGYAPDFSDVRQAFDMVMEALELTGGRSRAFLAFDIAASHVYDHNTNKYRWYDNMLDTDKMIAMYSSWVEAYPVYSIEDGLVEHDIVGWQTLTQTLKDKVQIIGDDLFVTNPYRIVQGIEQELATASIIKPNQIGTVTETLQAINLCKEHGMQVVVSHRSGETEDNFIVDLAVGTSAGHLKAGGLARGENISKYNQLLRIEDSLMMSLLG